MTEMISGWIGHWLRSVAASVYTGYGLLVIVAFIAAAYFVKQAGKKFGGFTVACGLIVAVIALWGYRETAPPPVADDAALAKPEWVRHDGLNAQCPHCHIGFRIESRHMGKNHRCNTCKRMFSPRQAKALGPPQQQRTRIFGIHAS